MVCYDVLNQVCIKSNLASAHQDELSIALAWVSHLPENSIAIYDRGYASSALVYLLNYYQKDFVIRCQSNRFGDPIQSDSQRLC